ncbi:possible neuromedin U precursor [Vibrio astriarenae]|nr:possible neuromedin U precursor [Vibrio sp. C7]
MKVKPLVALVLCSVSALAVAYDGDNQVTAEKAAQELANPNTAYASLNFKFQYNGDYEDGGSSFVSVFQPTMPFPLDNGDKIIFRPAVSYIDNDFNVGAIKQDQSGVSDISFDLAYAPKLEGGNIAAVGLIASLPTGSSELSSDQFAIGPELLIGKASAERVIGAFPNHLVGVAGSGTDEQRINKTSAQLFWVEILSGGWTVSSSPTMTYDWNTHQAEIPLNLSVSKTTVIGGRPWKLGLEANYYIEKDEKTRPDFMIGFNITPVVENQLTRLFD